MLNVSVFWAFFLSLSHVVLQKDLELSSYSVKCVHALLLFIPKPSGFPFLYSYILNKASTSVMYRHNGSLINVVVVYPAVCAKKNVSRHLMPRLSGLALSAKAEYDLEAQAKHTNSTFIIESLKM